MMCSSLQSSMNKVNKLLMKRGNVRLNCLVWWPPLSECLRCLDFWYPMNDCKWFALLSSFSLLCQSHSSTSKGVVTMETNPMVSWWRPTMMALLVIAAVPASDTNNETPGRPKTKPQINFDSSRNFFLLIILSQQKSLISWCLFYSWREKRPVCFVSISCAASSPAHLHLSPQIWEGVSLWGQKGGEEIASPHFNTATNPRPSPLPLRREAGAVVPMATNGPHCSQTGPHSLLTKRHTLSQSKAMMINTFYRTINTGEMATVWFYFITIMMFTDQQEDKRTLLCCCFYTLRVSCCKRLFHWKTFWGQFKPLGHATFQERQKETFGSPFVETKSETGSESNTVRFSVSMEIDTG